MASSLSGRIFLLTLDEFLEFRIELEDFFSNILLRFEYDDGILFFKEMSLIHG